MSYILIKGHEILIDDADLSIIDGWVWRLHQIKTNTYVRGYQKGKWKQKHFYMHRVLLNAQEGEDVDHRNGNGLDNRRCNIRTCTRTQNNGNMHAVRSKTSPYKGVDFYARTKNWRARITKDGKTHSLGYFDDIEAAAKAYRKKSLELYGEFSNSYKFEVP